MHELYKIINKKDMIEAANNAKQKIDDLIKKTEKKMFYEFNCKKKN